MTAQAILDKRLSEVDARLQAKKEAIRALFVAYPDIRAWAADIAAHLGPLKVGGMRWVVHGPMWQSGEYVKPVLGGHVVEKKRGKR